MAFLWLGIFGLPVHFEAFYHFLILKFCFFTIPYFITVLHTQTYCPKTKQQTIADDPIESEEKYINFKWIFFSLSLFFSRDSKIVFVHHHWKFFFSVLAGCFLFMHSFNQSVIIQQENLSLFSSLELCVSVIKDPNFGFFLCVLSVKYGKIIMIFVVYFLWRHTFSGKYYFIQLSVFDLFFSYFVFWSCFERCCCYWL